MIDRIGIIILIGLASSIVYIVLCELYHKRELISLDKCISFFLLGPTIVIGVYSIIGSVFNLISIMNPDDIRIMLSIGGFGAIYVAGNYLIKELQKIIK
ncbi:MAG: hypothetical protein ACE5KT_10770 [Methanosarcinales archaeon]